jgi:hypothetical protein
MWLLLMIKTVSGIKMWMLDEEITFYCAFSMLRNFDLIIANDSRLLVTSLLLLFHLLF